MCGFFAFTTGMSPREIADLFNLSQIPSSFEDIQSLKFYPRSRVPTVSKNSPNQLVQRYWQLIPRWYKDDPYKMKFSTFNARMEDIQSKATFRTPWNQSQRCLIPLSWFYEFETIEVEGEKRPKKLPYRVEVKDEAVFAIAGLYEVWRDAEGHPIESCTMITCKSVEPLRTIHTRQPVIINRENWEKWLDKDTPLDEAYNMLQPTKNLLVQKIDEGFNKAKIDELTVEFVKPISSK